MVLEHDAVRDLFHALLHEQEETGRKMAGNEYFTDAFHPGGPHNVGKDVLDAVACMRVAGDEVLRDRRCEATILTIWLSIAQKRYAAEHEDPDGYGSATFSEVIGKLGNPDESIRRFGINTKPSRRWWQFWK
jgi:hypothetical protein